MSNYFINTPFLDNEPVKLYSKGSTDRKKLMEAYDNLINEKLEIPQYIGSDKVFSGKKMPICPPHDHSSIVAYYHSGNQNDVKNAINCALKARYEWSRMEWRHRAAIFLKAADLIANKYRYRINAATMIGQSKNSMQAEIDSACELIDFLRFNVKYMKDIYLNQPMSKEGAWNIAEYRPLEGFTFAITPFNFTAISGNLPSCMALMGNVVVWKPSDKQVLSAYIIMEIFKEAGLPDGVINLVLTGGAETAKTCIEHPSFAGLHFTGSTYVFNTLWKQIGNNIDIYKTYPRIVGETGGKNFVLAHKSADPLQIAVALVRGAFEYQGQKCSAASRSYIPSNLWSKIKNYLINMISDINVGSPKDFSNFVNAVIDKKSFDKCKGYIDRAAVSQDAEIIVGGKCDDSVGYFVYPTLIQVNNPKYESMIEEIFGPILSVYVYDENDYDNILELIDETSNYGLTGSIFSQDRYAIIKACDKLKNSTGNFYINDKPTGAVVGQQPFGGSRASGTNDKAGSYLNLIRWTSVQTVKETFVSPTDYRYPFLEK